MTDLAKDVIFKLTLELEAERRDKAELARQLEELRSEQAD